jgi:hypothetical protein
MTDVDHTTTGVAHAYKQVDALDPEQAFFALVASPWRPHIGQGQVGGVRQRVLTVLLGDGVTLASEVTQLAAAYSTDAPRHPQGKSFADHLLWTRPPRFLKSGAPPFPHNELPWPYLDCRPVRLVARGDGVSAVALEGNNAAIQRLVEAGTGHIGDPHVPIIRDKATPMRLLGRMTYRQAHAALCGSDTIIRPYIVDHADAGRHVRIGAVARGQGKTIGYWETTVAVDRERWALFGVNVGDRLADLSKRTLTQCSVAETALWSAARALFPLARRNDPVADAYCRRAGDMLTDALNDIVLARAPYEWTRDGSPALSALTQAVFALSQIRHRGHPIGRALAETDYPEARVNSLLAATGPHLTELVEEVVRWLLAKDVEAVVLTDLITLAIADATADAEERDRARHRIALDYARATLRQNQRAA